MEGVIGTILLYSLTNFKLKDFDFRMLQEAQSRWVKIALRKEKEDEGKDENKKGGKGEKGKEREEERKKAQLACW